MPEMRLLILILILHEEDITPYTLLLFPHATAAATATTTFGICNNVLSNVLVFLLYASLRTLFDTPHMYALFAVDIHILDVPSKTLSQD